MFEHIEALRTALNTVRLHILDLHALIDDTDSRTHEQKLRDPQVRRLWDAYRGAANAALRLVFSSARWLPGLAAEHGESAPGEWTERLVQLISLGNGGVLPEWANGPTLEARACEIGERVAFLFRLGQFIAPPNGTTPPAAVPAPVRSWLLARYLSDPCPDVVPLHPERQPEPAVFVPLDRFTDFLNAGGYPLLPMLDTCRAAGLTDDIRIDLFESDGPTRPLPAWLTRCVVRLQLAVGQEHRLLAIRQAVLDSPASEPAGPLPSGLTPMRGEGGMPAEPHSNVESTTRPSSWIELDRTKQLILSALGLSTGALDGKKLAKNAPCSYSTLRKHIPRLVEWGYAISVSSGYVITPLGRDILPQRG